MAIVERSMLSARHISITLETGNVYKILLKSDVNKRFACARNGYTANMYVGPESTIVDGADDTLKIPVGEARQYVIPPLATAIYVSGQGTVELDVSPIPLNFNIAPASDYARAVAEGYTGTSEQFYTALAGVEDLGTSISELTDNGNITGFVVLTQTEYDALTPPDPKIVYIIQGV